MLHFSLPVLDKVSAFDIAEAQLRGAQMMELIRRLEKL